MFNASVCHRCATGVIEHSLSRYSLLADTCAAFTQSIIMSIISFYAKALNHLVTAIAADTAANPLTVENEVAG